MDRRQFLKTAMAGGAAAATTVVAGDAGAAAFDRPPKEMPPQAIGMLYDSTLCIGCKACVKACKEANGMPVDMPADLTGWNEGTWDAAEDLGGKTLNVIKVYQNGTMATKDAEENGYAFVKRHCLHCVDPSCVSVCPVGAMEKDASTGIVSHDPDKCIGCRYCVLGCPFGVPRYQYDNAFGEITKCQFCSHLQAKGEIPACCDVCPTGASLFGPVDQLKVEADRRLEAKAGETMVFPRGDIRGDRPAHEAPVANYQKHLYGENEVGGTQVRYLTAVSHEKLGLPKLPEKAFSRMSEGMQHTLYKGMIAPIALLGGLAFMAWKNTRNDRDDGEA